MRRLQKRVLDLEGVTAFFVIREEDATPFSPRRILYEPFSKTLYTYTKQRSPGDRLNVAQGGGVGEILLGVFNDDMSPVVLPIQKPSPEGYWLRTWYTWPWTYTCLDRRITHIHYPTFDMLTEAGERMPFDKHSISMEQSQVVCMDVMIRDKPVYATTGCLVGGGGGSPDKEAEHMATRRALRALLG